MCGVDLSVQPGQVTVLLGANGVGKSTLLDGIAGVVRARSGRIRLDGRDITRAGRLVRVAAGLGYVEQGRTVFGGLTVRENLLVVSAHRRVHRALQVFPELEPRLDVTASDLSGGEQQMLVLARALLQSPRILMIDELSLGLAPVVVDRMLRVVEHLVASGVGVLLVEQFAKQALAVGDQAIVMSKGRVEVAAPADSLRADPDLLRKAYLGSLDGDRAATTSGGTR